jgi:Tfp pilus assembly protein FimT
MKTFPANSGRARGYSLFEMLVFILLLAIFSSLAVTSVFGNLYAGSNQARAKRTAQEIVSEVVRAEAVGLRLVVPGDIDGTLRAVAAGKRASGGPFHGQQFGLTNLTVEDMALSKPYLALNNDLLTMRNTAQP